MRVLAIAAHADDETLGCGATLIRHRDAGDELHWLIVTSRTEPRWSAEAVAARRTQIERVTAAYAFSKVIELKHPDAYLDTVPLASVIEGIEESLALVRPDVVYVVHGGDVHSDHALVHTATMSALRSFRMGILGVSRVLSYETLSSTDAAVQDPRRVFMPTVFHDVSGLVEEKCHVLACYDSELQDTWLPRTSSAVTALARVRGAAVGVEHAEAFMLLRELS